MDSAAGTRVLKQANEKKISADTSITSRRRGFEFLNELFIKRHRKILWNSTKKISYICTFIIAGIMAVIFMRPEIKPVINGMILTWLPYFVFIMYGINRGTNFTQALFMNCDHSLLTYSFYKQPAFVLRLFRIRLREIMKINAVPALVIGGGLALILFVTGGTETPLNYALLIISVLFMSLFFSIHYLMIYYLLHTRSRVNGNEKRNVQNSDDCDIRNMLCFNAGSYAHPDIRSYNHCLLYCLQYCGEHTGLSLRAEDLQDQSINGKAEKRGAPLFGFFRLSG